MVKMEKIKLKIQNGEIEEAIHQLIIDLENTEYEKDLILMSSRNTINKRNNRAGIIPYIEYSRTGNKIIVDLLSLIDEVQLKSKEKPNLPRVETSKKSVLFCESNPLIDKNLLSNIEFREIEEIILNRNNRLQLKVKFGLSLIRFIQLINEFKPNIVHFTGFSNEEGIYFHNKADESEFIKSESFENYFEIVANQIDCIFFNTFISEKLAKRISTQKVFVIGFNGVIESLGAIEFATGFYTALGYGNGYKTAFDVGYQTIIKGKYENISVNLFAYFDGRKMGKR